MPSSKGSARFNSRGLPWLMKGSVASIVWLFLQKVDTRCRIDADESGAHHQMLTALDTML